MNDATLPECENACQAGQYQFCRWTPNQQCTPEQVCDGPGAVIINCAIPTMSTWGLVALAVLLVAVGIVLVVRSREHVRTA
jgi:hypothetical protein